jgi:hypothetical protein
LADTISEAEMATDTRSMVLTLAVVALVVAGLYLIDPTLFGLLKGYEGFQNSTVGSDSSGSSDSGSVPNAMENPEQKKKDTESNPNIATMPGSEGFGDYEEVTGPANFGGADAPAGCYPRDQLTPGELLPKDMNSVWAQQNPMGSGSLKGKNFLSAGSLIGVNTVGQSLRNANLQLRSEPPCPQVPVSVFNNSTIEPDVNRRDFEVN